MTSKYKTVCRVCLGGSSTVMCSLADQGTRKLLFDCTSITVDPNDGYPQQLCKMCWNQCSSWFDFKTLAWHSDKQLREKETVECVEEVIADEDGKDEQLHYIEGYSLAPGDEQQEMACPMKFEVEDHRSQGEITLSGEDPSEKEIAHVKEEVEDDEEEEIMMVREAPLEYIEGYSLVPEELGQEEEDDQEMETEDPLLCDAEQSPSKAAGSSKVKGTRNYKCRYCSITFPLLSELKHHMSVHTKTYQEKRPFECTECDKTFKLNSHLARHKLVHSEIKPFECDECPKHFSSKTHLRDHKLVHAGIRPFECDQCDQKFYQKSHLAMHKQSHSEMRPFKCDLCAVGFKYKQTLTRNLKKIHS